MIAFCSVCGEPVTLTETEIEELNTDSEFFCQECADEAYDFIVDQKLRIN